MCVCGGGRGVGRKGGGVTRDAGTCCLLSISGGGPNERTRRIGPRKERLSHGGRLSLATERKDFRRGDRSRVDVSGRGCLCFLQRSTSTAGLHTKSIHERFGYTTAVFCCLSENAIHGVHAPCSEKKYIWDRQRVDFLDLYGTRRTDIPPGTGAVTEYTCLARVLRVGPFFCCRRRS